MRLKSLASVCSQQNSFLVGKAYLRQADACNHNKNDKYLNSILFLNFEIKHCSKCTIYTYPRQ